MKCLLVVNQLNDPFYIDYDVDFAEYIIRRAQDKGLLEHDADITKLDANLVMQLFSPLINSQRLLIDRTKEPCSSIVCPNGFRFVFKHMEDLLIVTINGDGTESEVFLNRKIEVFIMVMRFMFGPVCEEMGQSHSYSKKAKWNFLRQLMNNWANMVESEQGFLVEAIERLHVNQVVSEKCVEILERSVKQIQAARDQPTQHAILLVNSKLLALYSNRSAHELRAKDILAVMILARTMYPRADRLEDLFAKHYIGSVSRSRASSRDDNSDVGDDEYHSAPNTPGGKRSRSPSVILDDLRQERILNNSSSNSLLSHDTITNLKDSPHSSIPGYEVIKDAGSSDQESSSHREDSESGPSLLDMYTEKYPDHMFQKVRPDKNNSHTKTQAGDKKCDLASVQLDVQVDVHPGVSPHLQVNLVEKENSNHSETQHEIDIDELEVTDYRSLPADVNSKRFIASQFSLEPNIDISTPSRSSSVISNLSKSYPELSSTNGQEFPFTGVVQTQALEDTVDAVQRNKRITPAMIGSYSNSELHHHHHGPTARSSHAVTFPLQDTITEQEIVSSKPSFNTYWPHTIFLETSACQYSPYNMHSIQVLPGVTVLFLSQAPRYAVADALFQVINSLQDLIYDRRVKLNRSQSIHVYDIINSLLSKLHNNLKKLKGMVKTLSFDIHRRWEKEDLKQKLLDYMEKDIRLPIPSELESPLLELYKKLKELFSHLFLTPIPHSPQFLESLSQIKVSMHRDLVDYREYLNVKAERNITMPSYFEDYPGLIHFIFIDRHFHQMSAPALNISLKAGENTDATSYLKEKIWVMYEHMMCKLTEGYTTVMLKEGDFYFSYFLWFEDDAGNALPVQESFKPSTRASYPGILCGSFYRELVHHCFPHTFQGSIRCFEMFLMHLGAVHPEYIAGHCKQLAKKMWEMSGEAYNSVSLL
ncbi:unnamed protein product [Lymnaea stagnalis]|uniref:Hermansky-Pudlak syndrome 1 protein homolog n=1 Tax=Lymnaea stagnalis TaxID=6523 RepID=A0AAV2HAX5_LYMST